MIAISTTHKDANYTVTQKDIASGGEAKISLIIDDNSRTQVAFKKFLQPDDPCFTTEADRKYCADKLNELYTKLQAFPRELPEHVVKPLKIQVAEVRGQKFFVGYTMPYIKAECQLYDLMTKDGRERHKLSMTQTTEIFLKLHDLIAEVHQKDVVIGDVRPPNILIKDRTPYLIDTDSMQFGTFKCKVFDPEWIDPRLCAEHNEQLIRVNSPDKGSDWFTFASMLYTALTGVGPYGGVLRTQSGIVSDAKRKLQGLSVFHHGVKVPPFALKPEYLNEQLAQYFEKIFTDPTFREPPPRDLLKSLTWMQCSGTQHEYSSSACPCGKCGGGGILLGLKNIFESLAKPARLGIAGASLAGALVGYKLFTESEQQPASNEVAMGLPFSEPTPPLSNTTTEPKLRPLVSAPQGGASVQQTNKPNKNPVPTLATAPAAKPNFLTIDTGSEPSTKARATSSAPSEGASQHQPGILSIPKLSRTSSAQSTPATTGTARPMTNTATTFTYTPQNSVDISKIYLTEGQRSFHEGNVPYLLDKHAASHFRLPERGSKMKISEGVLVQAVALGLDAMRKANQGSFPPGSSFRLVVSYQALSGREEERQFPIPAMLIPTEKELSYATVTRAAQGMRDVYRYFQENLAVHIAPYGTSHLSSAFNLFDLHSASNIPNPSQFREALPTQVRVIILRDIKASALSVTPTPAAAETRLNPTKSVTHFNYTPQNSADISRIDYPEGPSNSLKTATRALLFRGVAEWYDANQIVNPNLPLGTIDLLFSPLGAEPRGYFETPGALISAIEKRSQEKAMAAVDGIQDLSQYLQNNIGLQIAPNGTSHSELSFILAGKLPTPVNVYVFKNPSFKYPQEKSSDISKIYLADKELVGHDLLKKWLIVKAVAVGLEAMRNANQGSFPAGSTFKLVVSHEGALGQREERQFMFPADLIPTDNQFSTQTVMRAAHGMRDVCQYIRDNLAVQVFPLGPTHIASAFVSPKSPDKPVRVYILREPQ